MAPINRCVIKEEKIAINRDCASKTNQLVSHWDVTTGDYFDTHICDKNLSLRPFTHSSYNERVIETYLRLSEAKIILIISLQLFYDHLPTITRHSKEHYMVVVGDK